MQNILRLHPQCQTQPKCVVGGAERSSWEGASTFFFFFFQLPDKWHRVQRPLPVPAERSATRKHYFREQARQCAAHERPYSWSSLEGLVLHCLVCISFVKLVLQIFYKRKERKFAFSSAFALPNEPSKRFICRSPA